jgi:hypothetical protein
LVEWTKCKLEHEAEHAKGEFVVVLGAISEAEDDRLDTPELERLFGLITEHVTSDDDSAIKAVAAMLDTSVRQVRKAVKKARIRARRAEEHGSD